MQFSEVIDSRRSVRKFADRPVEDEKLEYVLQAARRSPSADNRQSATFVVVRDPAIRATIGRPRSTSDGKWINKWLAAAPVIIVACGNRSKSSTHHGVEFWQVDTAIAVEHLALAAVDAGLGSCWVGAFDEASVRAALAIPESEGVLALLALGYPAERMGAAERLTRSVVRADTRKPMSDLVRWDTW